MKSPSIKVEIANSVQTKSAVGNVRGNSNFEGDRILRFNVVSLQLIQKMFKKCVCQNTKLKTLRKL